MILVFFHGHGCIKRGFIVDKVMLQPNLEGMSLLSQRMIYNHLVSNEFPPQSITVAKQLRDSVHKARSRQKAEALTKDINELKPKKVMLEKLQETLKSDSESLMMKAAEDLTKAHAYAVEEKSIMDERNRKVVEIEELSDTINSLEKKRKEF